MKTSALTIRLDGALEHQLAALAKRSGRSRSDIARDALRRQLAVMQFDEARRSIMPFAEARGYLTDEDVGVEADPHAIARKTSSSVR
jgi:predicted transcriptional regulator